MSTATGQFTQGDYLLGVEGLAILRAAQRREFDKIEDRRAEIKTLLDGQADIPYSLRRDLPLTGIEAGYTIWADTYDHPNEEDFDPIIQLEQPTVRRLMDTLPDGPILDAACGTGRHTAYLVEKGRDVVGIDAVDAMLDMARAKLPGVDFQRAELSSLPLGDESFAGIVCGLAYSHLEDLGPSTQELARVLRPGGRMIVSAPHPFITSVLGWRAPVFDAEGNGVEMPEYGNGHGAYIAAFREAGLTVVQCVEPRLSEAQARWNPSGEATPEDTALEEALAGQPGVFVWDVARA
jgi:SAM-dependent methyltransferase